MKKEALLKEKQQLEANREQVIAQVNQLTGAIAMIEKLINEAEEEGDKEPSEAPEEKAA